LSLELTMRVRSALADGMLRVVVYVLDLFGDTEAQSRPITVGISHATRDPDHEHEIAFDLTPSEAEALRDYLDFLLYTKPWLEQRP
jgi:hypothetical protein